MAERKSTNGGANNGYKDFNIKVEKRDHEVFDAQVRFYKVKNARMPFTLTLLGEIVVKGCAVVDGKNGLFVSMPSYKSDSDGKYYDYVHPVSAETRESLYGQLTKLADSIWAEM